MKTKISTRATRKTGREAYKKHLAKWNKARELVRKYNEDLISYWRSIPWYRFWERLSFEEQRQIVLDNWRRFEQLPAPRLEDYFPIKLTP